MNKFIEYDIHNGITQLKCAIMNILEALNSGEITEYCFDTDISKSLIKRCLKEANWRELSDTIYTNPSFINFTFDDTIIKRL